MIPKRGRVDWSTLFTEKPPIREQRLIQNQLCLSKSMAALQAYRLS